MQRTDLIQNFQRIYGEGGEIRTFFAPGRVNLIGEHTDYNGGHVFPCALKNGTYGVIRKREDRRVRLVSLNTRIEEIKEFSLEELTYQKESGWANYPKGVLWALSEDGYEIPAGMEILYYGTIPSGAGLSSSASIEVLTALMVRELYDLKTISTVDLAVYSQKAERDFVGVDCGIMDQFASAMGREENAIFLNASNLKYEYIPLKLKDIHLVITNSKVRHKLASSEYNKRHEECNKALKKIRAVVNVKHLADLSTDQFKSCKDVIMDATLIRRARHVVSENARTIRAVNALRVNNFTKFGMLMTESHNSLKSDYEVSCPEIDDLVASALEVEGVLGSRITGGGFGGCTVSLVKDEAIEGFRKHLSEMYQEKYHTLPEFYVVESGDGAHEIV